MPRQAPDKGYPHMSNHYVPFTRIDVLVLLICHVGSPLAPRCASTHEHLCWSKYTWLSAFQSRQVSSFTMASAVHWWSNQTTIVIFTRGIVGGAGEDARPRGMRD